MTQAKSFRQTTTPSDLVIPLDERIGGRYYPRYRGSPSDFVLGTTQSGGAGRMGFRTIAAANRWLWRRECQWEQEGKQQPLPSVGSVYRRLIAFRWWALREGARVTFYDDQCEPRTCDYGTAADAIGYLRQAGYRLV